MIFSRRRRWAGLPAPCQYIPPFTEMTCRSKSVRHGPAYAAGTPRNENALHDTLPSNAPEIRTIPADAE